MAYATVSFNTDPEVENAVETTARWLSCNGELWGVGPTAVFASAAALFLYHELQATLVLGAGDRPSSVSMLEGTLVTTMVVGLLALMIHLWVCSMRFFQYYLETIIKDSPNMILEMTTTGLFGGHNPSIALAPFTKFLKQQQPMIHITICWFLSLCYADYVRKHYCRHFNMPYLEQWQADLHERAVRSVNKTIAKVNSFVGAVQQRLRDYVQPTVADAAEHTVSTVETKSSNTVETAFGRMPTIRTGRLLSRGTMSGNSRTTSLTNVGTPTSINGTAVAACRVSVSEFYIGGGQDNDASKEAYEKLKAYIKATRCSCSSQNVENDPKAIKCTQTITKIQQNNMNEMKNIFEDQDR